MGNSLRDEIKDIVRLSIMDSSFYDSSKGDPIDLVCNITDNIFEVLGIPEEEQDLPIETAIQLLNLGR